MSPLFRRIISCSLSPNTERDDVWAAVKTLCKPWIWRKGRATEAVTDWFTKQFDPEAVVAVNSGRSALLLLLESLGIGRGDEVLVQAFTCVAVPNSVKWVGATPVFVDIDANFNLDAFDAQKKLTKHTKAVIVQHTFGVPADMDAIRAFVRKHKLLLIEDCAHGLGGTYHGKKLGTFGDAAFFSFGRDKVVSSVWGGVALINAKCRVSNAKSKLKEYHKKLPPPSFFWIFQQLLHPIAFSFILMSYNMGIGKAILFVLQKIGLLSKPVYRQELHGGRPKGFPATYPNGLAVLVLCQLSKLTRFVANRQTTAAFYHKKLAGFTHSATYEAEATYLRYPVILDGARDILAQAKTKGILLGNWYHHTVDPQATQLGVIGYRVGSCPRAEYAASRIVNLPTLIDAYAAGNVVSLFGVQ